MVFKDLVIDIDDIIIISDTYEEHVAVLTHMLIRPIDQWAAKDGCAGPPINRANGRPMHQWGQPTHQ